ncbi:MAG: hypothetical protein ACRDQZ_19070, partial [Mycobacteriales bacterium]
MSTLAWVVGTGGGGPPPLGGGGDDEASDPEPPQAASSSSTRREPVVRALMTVSLSWARIVPQSVGERLRQRRLAAYDRRAAPAPRA